MSDHIIKTIEQVREEVEVAEQAIRPKKMLVNQLCGMAGIQPYYPGIEDSTAATGKLSIRRNAFYGKPLSTSIKEILEMRVNLPVREATLDEIFEALKAGGYDLKASGETEADQKRGVSITLGKNTQSFHRVASGDYGLVSWYPNIREKRSVPPSRRDIQAPPTDPNLKYANDCKIAGGGSPEDFTTEDAPEGIK